MSESHLTYNAETGRWTLDGCDLHCGDCFRLFPGRDNLPPVDVRIEHNSNGWYLVTPYGITLPSTRKAAWLT